MNKWLKNILTLGNGKNLKKKDLDPRANAQNAINPWMIPIAISLGGLCALAVLWKKKKNEITQESEATELARIQIPIAKKNLSMSDYVLLEQLINNLSLLASESLNDVVLAADDLNIDRSETLAYFVKIMSGLLNQLDLDEYEPNDEEDYN